MDEQRWAHFSAARVFIWIGVLVLAILFGWLASVVFVSACSLYANIASDFAAYRADKNEELKKTLEQIKMDVEYLRLATPTPQRENVYIKEEQ